MNLSTKQVRRLAFLAAALIASTVCAHEYVLLARDFFVKKGERLEMRLFVADGFNIEIERPFQPSMTKSFRLLSENGNANLIDSVQEGDLPILKTEVDFKGLGLIHMERDFARIEMSNEDFVNYLRGDNIENVRIDDSTRSEQSERYTRYLKALVQSDPVPGDTLHKAVVGHAFEIVLLQNPYGLEPGDWVYAQALFEGKPLADKAITARNRVGNRPAAVQYSRTDANGVCSFKLERGGEWFIHATHMIPSRDPEEADWESFWTSYSFGFAEEE